MNKFIKKNMVLVIVLAATLIGVGVMAFLVTREHGAMQAYMKQTEDLKDKIKELIKQKPAPVEGNLDRLKKDAEGYKEKSKGLVILFGKPFYPAAKKFAEEMGMSVDEFRTKLSTFWDSNKASGVTRDQMYGMFKAGFNNPEKWDKAIQNFTVEAQKYTLERIDENNVDEILLASFGLARNLRFSGVRCDNFMKDLRFSLVDLYNADKDKRIDFGPAASSFSFDFKGLPERDSIPDIVKCWLGIEDLAKRLVGTGVTYLDFFNKESLTGRVDGNYTTYRFTIGVRGDLDSIRKVMENLYKAYSERRVYVVSGIALAKSNDEAEQLIIEAESKLYGGSIMDENPEFKPATPSPDMAPSPPPTPDDGMGGATAAAPAAGRSRAEALKFTESKESELQRKKDLENEMLEQKRKQQEKLNKGKMVDNDPDKHLPYFQRRSYGKVIIGADKQCRAVLDIDYVVYTGQDLKE
ncbi:MAG: hypothetical protein ACYC4Q_04755 [Victivallaceae bacterium]